MRSSLTSASRVLDHVLEILWGQRNAHRHHEHRQRSGEVPENEGEHQIWKIREERLCTSKQVGIPKEGRRLR